MYTAPPLLSAVGVGPPSRSASRAVAKPARGFHVFRIDGYSWSKTLPAGERMSSESFAVGGLYWYIDYYPNGTSSASAANSGDDDSADSVAVYLRMHRSAGSRRVRAEFKFSLLDHAAGGAAAYELPADTAVFTPAATASAAEEEEDEDHRGCGYKVFISKVELERRRDRLLRDDCLAIRCDVGVAEVAAAVAVGSGGPSRRHSRRRSVSRAFSPAGSSESEWDDDRPLLPCKRGGGQQEKRRQQPELDDREFIRRCLASKRHRQ